MAKEAEFSYAYLESLSDEALCAAIGHQQRLAEAVLADRYLRLVRSCARPFFLVGGDSEDLIQEGMLGLIKAMRAYDPARGTSFHTFAETCIRNCLLSVIRQSAADKNVPLNQSIPLNPSDPIVDFPFAQVDPELIVIDREMTAILLENTRKQLSDFEEKILGLYLDGLTYGEIAKTVGRPIKSVDNAVQRIRRKVDKVVRQLSSGDISNG